MIGGVNISEIMWTGGPTLPQHCPPKRVKITYIKRMTITLFFFQCMSSIVRPRRQLLVYSDSSNCLAVFVAQSVWKPSKRQSKRLKRYQRIETSTRGLRIANCPDAQRNLRREQLIQLAVSGWLELGVVLLKILTPAIQFFFFFFFYGFIFSFLYEVIVLFKSFAF